jgi:DNA-binding transcriptional regulator YhcF (GntR family)
MRLWLNRSGEISLREQLITQVILGILTREILPGDRLPSIRELARRFGIHSNTASAAYRELEREGWVEFRHGSGVFVSAAQPTSARTPEMAAKARKVGVGESLLRARLRRWLSFEPPARWLLIEPDGALREIVMHEMEGNLALPVLGCVPGECGAAGTLAGAIPVVLPSKAAVVRKLLPAGMELTVMQVRPVTAPLQASLQRYLPEHASDLIGIASGWSEFQRIAQTMLVAAGLRPESLMVRNTARPGWKRGLEATSGVVCDALTAQQLPKGCFPMVFRLLSDESFAQLRVIEMALTARQTGSE